MSAVLDELGETGDVALLRKVLLLNATIVAEAKKVRSGDLELNDPLPMLGIKSVALNYRPFLAKPDMRAARARTRITAYGHSFREVNGLLRLCRDVCDHFTGEVEGYEMVTILLGPTGPDMTIPAPKVRYKSQDFHVSFNEPTT